MVPYFLEKLEEHARRRRQPARELPSVWLADGTEHPQPRGCRCSCRACRRRVEGNRACGRPTHAMANAMLTVANKLDSTM
jgi:hypothetical protein